MQAPSIIVPSTLSRSSWKQSQLLFAGGQRVALPVPFAVPEPCALNRHGRLAGHSVSRSTCSWSKARSCSKLWILILPITRPWTTIGTAKPGMRGTLQPAECWQHTDLLFSNSQGICRLPEIRWNKTRSLGMDDILSQAEPASTRSGLEGWDWFVFSLSPKCRFPATPPNPVDQLPTISVQRLSGKVTSFLSAS